MPFCLTSTNRNTYKNPSKLVLCNPFVFIKKNAYRSCLPVLLRVRLHLCHDDVAQEVRDVLNVLSIKTGEMIRDQAYSFHLRFDSPT